MKFNILLIAFWIFSQLHLTAALSKTRNLQFEEKTDLVFGSASPILFNDLIIYQTQDDNGYSLWSFNPGTAEKKKFFTGRIWRSVNDKYLHSIDGKLYFVSGDYDFKDFWQSDGTPGGTSKIPSTQLFDQHRQVGGLLFAQANDGSLISTNGTDVIKHDIQYAEVDNICAFSINDVISKQFSLETNKTTLVRSNSEQTIEIFASENLPNFFAISKENMWVSENYCYIGITKSDQTLEVLVISDEGDVFKLNELLNLNSVTRIFNFKNSIYMFLGSYGEDTKIVRLKSDFSGFDAEFQAPENANYFFNVITSNDYIIASSLSVGTPHPYYTHYLDRNLIKNEQLDQILGAAFLPIPEVYQILEGEVFVKFIPGIRSNSYQISTGLQATDATSLGITDALLNHVITDHSTSDVYMLLTDKISGKRSIYSLADVPDINDSIAGQWHNPDIKSQGLSIKVGERFDGSDYLFLTVYTYKEGEPFWLAGVSNINPPQNSIDVLVSDYRGIDMFEQSVTPQQNIFGNVNLEMKGCNKLQAVLTTDEEVITLDLVRIDNVRYDYLCSE